MYYPVPRVPIGRNLQPLACSANREQTWQCLGVEPGGLSWRHFWKSNSFGPIILDSTLLWSHKFHNARSLKEVSCCVKILNRHFKNQITFWKNQRTFQITKNARKSLKSSTQILGEKPWGYVHHGRTIPIASARWSPHWIHVRPSPSASEQNHFHSSAAQRAGVTVPEDSLPWCIPERGSRVEDQLVGSQSASKL